MIYLTPGIFVLFHYIKLTLSKNLTPETLFFGIIRNSLVMGVPLLIANVLFMIIAWLMPYNQALLNQSDGSNFWWSEGFFTTILFSLLIGYVAQLMISFMAFMIVFLPILAVKKPDVVSYATSLMRVSNKKMRNFITLVFFSGISAFLIGILMAYMTLGFSKSIFLAPSQTWFQLKWIYAEVTYGIHEGQQILWAFGILLVVVGLLMMLYTFVQLQISKWFDRREGSTPYNKYWRNISLLLLISTVGPLFINNEAETLAVDYERFPDQIEFTDDFTESQMLEEKEDVLSFLDEIDFVDMTRGDRNWYSTEKRIKSYEEEEEIYRFISDNLIGDNQDFSYNFDVTNDESAFKTRQDMSDEKINYKEIPEIYLQERGDSAMEITFEKDGLYYSLGVISHSDQAPNIEDLTSYIDKMSRSNDLASAIKQNSSEQFDDKLNAPKYFVDNLKFHALEIRDNGIDLSYQKRFEKNGHDSMIKTGVDIEINDEAIDPYNREGKQSEISMNDGTKAELYLASKGDVSSGPIYHQNSLFFKYDSDYYKVFTNNLERPVNSLEPENLLKISNDLIEAN